MLKSELIRPRIKIQDDRISMRPIEANYRYLGIATDLINLFKAHTHQSRGQLHNALRDYEGDSLDYPVIRGLASVLEARCDFGSAPPIDPAELREQLFRRGPVTSRQDLFNLVTREQAFAEMTTATGLTPDDLEAALFADLAEEQILLDPGPPVAPGDLIARYNLELARGLLYWAREMRIRVADSYKDLFKYIKLFKLMYTIRPILSALDSTEEVAAGSEQGLRPPGYHVTLHGPISPFVQSTIRYGLQFAKFLPALLLCRRWHMEADVQPPHYAGSEPLRYTLTDNTPLRSHFKASGMFDSQLEADFAAEFEEKYGGAKRKWELVREDELIVVGDTVMIPDFSLTHRKDGRRALLEIVGFWHPHYLRRKLEKIRLAGRSDLILLIYSSANVAEGTFEAASAGEVLNFTRKPVLKDVLAAVERCAIPVERGT
ncbi:MAG: DUF790 family protein [Anaerolineae bacterium]|nr:DUF790 family protein [Anaerolineae bacterium]